MFKEIFRKKRAYNKRVKDQSKSTTYNYCLFISGNQNSSIKFGIFYSSLSPGIKDYRNGILYIAPEEYINKNIIKLTPYAVRDAIFKYYGIESGKKILNQYNDDLWFS